MSRPKSNGSSKDSNAHLSFETKLWLAADSRSEAAKEDITKKRGDTLSQL